MEGMFTSTVEKAYLPMYRGSKLSTNKEMYMLACCESSAYILSHYTDVQRTSTYILHIFTLKQQGYNTDNE